MPKTEVPQYHRVFVPLSDLYSLSGQGVFSHLSCGDKDRRNLVAVPLSMVNLLGRLKNEGLVGAAATLRYLREIQQERPLLSSVGESGLRIHRVSEGLDIAFCPSSGREELDLISPLEKKLRKYQSNQGTHRVTALTGNDEIQISLSAKGVHVERPLFLLVNADIVFEGILEGTSRLLARLYESEGHVPLDSATMMAIVGVKPAYRGIANQVGRPEFVAITCHTQALGSDALDGLHAEAVVGNGVDLPEPVQTGCQVE